MTIPYGNFHRRYLKFLLACLCVYETDHLRYKIHVAVIAICGMITIIFLTVRLFVQSRVIDILQSFPYFSYTIFYNIVAYNFIINRGAIRRIISQIDIGIYEYKNQELREVVQMHVKEDQIKRSFFILGIITYSAFIGQMLPPLICSIYLKGTNVQNYNNYLWMPSWYPYKINSFPVFYATNVFQVLTQIPVYFLCVTAVVLPVYIFGYFQSHKKALILNLSNIGHFLEPVTRNQEAKQNADEWKRKEFRIQLDLQHEVIDCNLRECMRHHNALIRMINDFIIIYKWSLFYYIAFCCWMFTLSAYLLKADDDLLWPEIVQRILTPMIAAPTMLYYCYISECMNDFNSECKFALYSVKWYQYSNRFRKQIMLVVSMMNWNSGIRYTFGLALTFSLYTSILKASYTYLNYLSKFG